MGSEGDIGVNARKPRVLCLHGFRTSAEILKKQIHKWPESLLQKMDLVFADAPFPCQGKSDVEGIFDPPYYEWFQFNKEFTEYTNFDECLKYIEDFMIEHGPFDGLLGFSQVKFFFPSDEFCSIHYSNPSASKLKLVKCLNVRIQGAILSGGLPGLQEKGVALNKVSKVKFLIIIGGAKFRAPSVAEKAYASPISCPSLHFLGETDFLRPYGAELLESCVEPVVIKHPKGHTIPRIDDDSLKTVTSFIERVQKLCEDQK
ncbi:esterase AGAP003155-like isoform X1 [Neltuma alba]|uniref:esterase AGAP003155-like isoform X1 n=1 Tax=Neltuma alba TaxID=207710 RepID=UPI0010A52AA0|nr:esterase AGAP003155-like isoform X1 [Prosopis alba]